MIKPQGSLCIDPYECGLRICLRPAKVTCDCLKTFSDPLPAVHEELIDRQEELLQESEQRVGT